MKCLALLLLLAACTGDDERLPDSPDAGTQPDAAADPCIPLTLGAPDFQVNGFGQLTGLQYPVTSQVGEAAADTFVIELYDSTTPDLPPLAPGTFDLAEGVDAQLATCQHCAYLVIDHQLFEGFDPVAFQSAGTMTVTHVDDPLSPAFAGSLEGLHLVPVAPREDGTGWDPVPGDSTCYRLAPLAFDTVPETGRACERATDCNPFLQICDPDTRTCQDFQCGDFFSCADPGDACIVQHGDFYSGACYEVCTPGVSHCANGLSCVQFGLDPEFGLCESTGTGLVGQACEPADVTTGCESGAVCSPLSRQCVAECAFFTEHPGCPDGSRCSLFGRCEPPDLGDPAPIGSQCAPGAQLADGCGVDGEAYRGICFAFDESQGLDCKRACLAPDDCAETEFCALRFSSGLGVCEPDPVCGDGVKGEIGELCDDGNTDDGDACSGDCQAVDAGFVCAQAAELPLDTTVSGTTTTDGFQASCQFGEARTRSYTLTPPGAGRLTITVDGPKRFGVSVRQQCLDLGSELACQGPEPFGANVLSLQVTSGAPLTVMVGAFTVLEEGDFTIQASFVAEQCGDGILAGREVCDDGNTVDRDGCRADCRSLHYQDRCDAIPALTLGTIHGDNSTGLDGYVPSCGYPGDTIRTAGEDLYRFVAPSNGTLHVRLPENDLAAADHALYVLDACSAPGKVHELSCTSVYGEEFADIPMVAGQEVVVVVDAFNGGRGGPYELTASFQ